MGGGLMGLIRYGCSIEIANFENFTIQRNIDFTIRLYILVLKQKYGKDFNKSHAEFTIKQFDKLFEDNTDWKIDEKDDEGNSYLHEVCCSTMWGHPFCVELFEYFLSKGLDPREKNNDGKSPIDLVNEQYLEKAIESMENFLRHI
jgi:hypothetical protein